MSRRVIRRALEVGLGIAMLVFIFSRPTSKSGILFFIGSIIVMILCLSLAKKWPLP